MIKGGRAPLRKWIVPFLILSVTVALFYYGYRRRHPQNKIDKDHLLMEWKPVQISGGWGYLIFMNKHVYIRQYVIPALPGSHPFRTREDAMAVGQKVFDRLNAGAMPIVSAAEVRAMGIYPDTLVRK